MMIRNLDKKRDIFKASELISRVFNTFNNKEGSKEAVESYINFYKPNETNKSKIEESFNRTDIAFVLEDRDKIIGLIRGNRNRIINLFLDENYHGNGYGQQLINSFEDEAKSQSSEFIKVNASLYATKFYQKMGYKKTTGIRNFRGLLTQPMVKRF